ncbi:hypothetical protein Bbelb_064400 [Branchiostoma belcheri]|nr:hypothetical protein Bbelb_064400 [Branchiostoma belcheri]
MSSKWRHCVTALMSDGNLISLKLKAATNKGPVVHGDSIQQGSASAATHGKRLVAGWCGGVDDEGTKELGERLCRQSTKGFRQWSLDGAEEWMTKELSCLPGSPIALAVFPPARAL